jgi:hypothetical protein
MSGFPRLFFLIVFRVFLSDESSKTLQKSFYKNIVSKSFYKKNRQKSKTVFSRLFYHVSGRFSMRGVQKHDKKSGKTDQTWYFFGLRGTNQPRGPSCFFLVPLPFWRCTGAHPAPPEQQATSQTPPVNCQGVPLAGVASTARVWAHKTPELLNTSGHVKSHSRFYTSQPSK